jgi:hypothetical protein
MRRQPAHPGRGSCSPRPNQHRLNRRRRAATRTGSTANTIATSTARSHTPCARLASSSKTPARRPGPPSCAPSPDRYAIFAWLRVVAIHEAYRLAAIDRCARHLERLNLDEHNWQELTADPRTLDEAVTALEALRTLASLPERQRGDLTLKIAGYSYEEIRALTPGRTFTNVSKSLVKARAKDSPYARRSSLTPAARGQIAPPSLLWSEMSQATTQSTR